MRTKLLTPGWVAAHLLVAAFVVACGWLGWWQWERAESATGTLQNFGYALQWPLFGVSAIYMWRRAVRMETRPQRPADEAEPAAQGQSTPVTPASQHHASQPSRPRAQAAPRAADEIDDELAAYNRYLAQLHASDQRHAG